MIKIDGDFLGAFSCIAVALQPESSQRQEPIAIILLAMAMKLFTFEVSEV